MSWEAQGRQGASLLDDVFSVVVAGRDPIASASFAIGVARMLGATRRVAIADLIGELPPLQALLTGDDPHGISDSFLYGVSLNKIAQPIEGTSNVFLMPSGTESVAIESVYNNDRWRRLAAGFHQVGALLIIVAAPNTPGFEQLCEYVGAVFPIDDAIMAVPESARVIAVRRPTPPTPERTAARALAAAAQDTGDRRRRLIVIGIALLAVAILVGALFPRILTLLSAPFGRAATGTVSQVASLVDSGAAATPAPSTVTSAAASAALPAGTVTGAGTRAADSVNAGSRMEPLVAVNPADSARAAAYSVYLSAGKSIRDATPDDRVQKLQVVAISPVLMGSDQTPWFRATVGATDDITQAQTMLARLRVAKVLGETSGSIIRVPYAFRLEPSVSVDSAVTIIERYARRSIAAYGLKQTNGRATIYTGAYESPEQALWLAESMWAAGITPVLVFRTGRAF